MRDGPGGYSARFVSVLGVQLDQAVEQIAGLVVVVQVQQPEQLGALAAADSANTRAAAFFVRSNTGVPYRLSSSTLSRRSE